MSPQPPDTLALLERPEQIDPLLAATGAGPGVWLVALTPHAEYALERRGLPYVTIEAGIDPRRAEDLGAANFGKVESLCRRADGHWRRTIPYLDRHDLEPAWSQFFYFKMLYDSVTVRLFELEGLFASHPGAGLVLFETRDAACDERMFWLEESVYTRVALALARARDVPVRLLPRLPVQDPADIPWRGPVRPRRTWARLPLLRRLRIVVRGLQGGGNWRALGGLAAPGRRRNVLFCSSGYGFPRIAADLLASGGPTPWFWDEGSIPFPMAARARRARREPAADPISEAECLASWAGLREDPEFRALLRWGDLDWFGVVEARMRSFGTLGLRRMAAVHAEARAVFERVAPAAVVFATTVGVWAKGVAGAARSQQVPVVVIPHGEIGTHHVPIVYYNDLVTADWYLVGGSGTAAYLGRHHGAAVRSVVTGSPMYDGLAGRVQSRRRACRRFGLDAGRRVVVYNLTTLDGNYRYLTRRQPSDSRQFRIHRRVVDVFREFPEVQLVIKAHPARGSRASPIEDYIRDGGLPNGIVLAEPPFETLIHLADAFLIDCPSTSLLQMVATETPIYVFNDWFHWEPEALAALEARAFVFDDLDRFCEDLAADLRSGRCFERRRVDRTLYRRYAVPEDGQAAACITRFLTDLARGAGRAAPGGRRLA